jgi:hypothetical protein
MSIRLFTVLCVAALLVTFTAMAADVSGTWTGEQQGRNGPMTVTLNLKAEGNTLSGTISGRGGETAISDGKIDGDNVSFTVTREFNGNTMKMKYSGTVSGSEMKLKVEREGSNQPARELTLKKSTT